MKRPKKKIDLKLIEADLTDEQWYALHINDVPQTREFYQKHPRLMAVLNDIKRKVTK